MLPPDHYDPPAGPRAYVALALWIAAGVVTLALRATVRTFRMVRRATVRTCRLARRALLTMRPTWTVGAVALAVAVPLASALATWAALGGGGRAGGITAGVLRVEAASDPADVPAAPGSLTFGDPRLQPGYVDPAAVGNETPVRDDPMEPLAPAAEAHAGPAGEPLPAWLPPTVARWETLIRAGAEPYSVDPALVAIVMTIESAGNRKAGSKAGARSLMQVMPATARGIDRERGRPHDPAMIEDPAANIDYGVYNLAWCMRTYGLADDPDWRQTIGRACRCYNGGPGAVDNPPEESRDHDRWVTGMWAERHDASSPTFDEWRAAGGQVALDIAATVDGPPMYVQPVAPGGPDHLEVMDDGR